MSISEILLYRIPQQLQHLLLGKIQQKKPFDVSTISVQSNNVKLKYQAAAQLLSQYPDQTFLKYGLFDVEVNLNNQINWLKDYSSLKTSNKNYYANINRQNFNSIGDVKYVAELSRAHFLPFLALKESVEKNGYYIDLVVRLLDGWLDQNPYLRTIHWTSGIEVGIRSVNLIFTHLVLNNTGVLTSKSDILIKNLILRNYQFLKNHLSLYSSANNHLVAELTGLVIISSYFDSKNLKEQRSRWVKLLYQEILNQTNIDGVNMELSTHYHAEVTDHFFNALLFIKNYGDTIPENVLDRFKQMFVFLDHVEYQNNKTIFGDNDEGFLIYPYCQKNFSIYQSLLQSARIEYNMNFSSKIENNYDLRNYLLFGDAIFKTQFSKNKSYHPNIIFKQSGYAFLYDHDNAVKVAFDFGPIGDNLMAAHGHSDVLHFIIEKNGHSLISDSGTYQYHQNYSEWREYFRGISAHNTISINNENHAKPLTRMSWINRPTTKLLDYNIAGDEVWIEAETDAFKKHGIIHNRKLILKKSKKELIINDQLFQSEKHKEKVNYQFYINFSDLVLTKLKENQILVNIKQNEVLTIKNTKFNKGKLIKGNVNPIMGWYSDKYNTKTPSETFVLNDSFNGIMCMQTIIEY
jgi:hypothetical protein